MFKNIACCILSLIMCTFFANVQSESAQILVGTNAEFPPFTYIENGEIIGFDIDIAKEVAKRLGRQIKFKDMPFDSLISDLTLGRVDFVAAGMSYTLERSQRVCFTKPHFTSDFLVVLTLQKKEKDKISFAELPEVFAGKTIVVNEGYTADIALTPLKGFKLVRLGNTADGFLSLKSKRADAFVTAKSTVNAFLEKQKSISFYQIVIEETAEKIALAVSQKNPQLCVQIQEILDEMGKDGTLDQIKAKWKMP